MAAPVALAQCLHWRSHAAILDHFSNLMFFYTPQTKICYTTPILLKMSKKYFEALGVAGWWIDMPPNRWQSIEKVLVPPSQSWENGIIAF